MTPPLFRRLLGVALDGLPASLCTVHDGAGRLTLAGTARVWRSANPVARLLCDFMGLPAAGAAVPLAVTFDRRGGEERWHRRFAGRAYHSRFSARRGLLVERMGPATNLFRVSVQERAIQLDLVGFRFLGVPLPSSLRPACHAVEADDAGAFTLDVPVSLPWLGPVIRYSGRLVPVGGD